MNRYNVGGGAYYMKVPLASVSVSPPKSRQVQSAKKLPNSASKKSRSPIPRPSYTQSNYRNEELENKTEAIQREYDALLNELLENRQATNIRGKDEGFYRVMNDYIKEYTGEPGFFNHNLRKHTSPTKRLISMKNTAFSHKKVMNEQGINTDTERGPYKLTYCSSPGKMYLVQPHGGELNYRLVDRSPEKFYNQVFNQEIT